MSTPLDHGKAPHGHARDNPHEADHAYHNGAHDHDHDHDHDHGDGHGDHDHDHDHGDGHGGVLSTIWHAISEFLGFHSHDPADAIDDALESSKRGTKALIISFTVLFVTALIQLVIVWLTGSVALFADTIHNFSDALTAVPLFVAFRLGRRPPNKRYTYGFRRAEDLAGLFVVLMIAASAIAVAWESIDRLINPQEVSFVGVLFVAGIIGFIGNELVALYRIRIGREIGSAALVADGLHARVDGWTSLAVAVGAVFIWLGFERADPIIGILVSIAILGALRTAGRDIYRRLMDAVDPHLVGHIEEIVPTVPGVKGLSIAQIRWMGHRLRADIGIRVDGSVPVSEGHEIGEAVSDALKHGVRHLDQVLVHVDGVSTPTETSPELSSGRDQDERIKR